MIDEVMERLSLGGVLPGASTGTAWLECSGKNLSATSPIDGREIGVVKQASGDDYEKIVAKSVEAFLAWRTVPAPQRGELVRRIGLKLREHKKDLGRLVALENGKILAEGEGEVQEMIDMCDFAVGQSRMLYGLSMQSERHDHRMYEQWQPLGPVGVITSFNFPIAVWAWNAMLALICGDTVIWKPSSKVPLCAIATQKIAAEVVKECGYGEGILSLAIGSGEEVGERLITDSRVPLVSATGSVAMGRRVGIAVAERMGRPLLELGGNNGVIVTPSADLNLTLRAVLFGAVGTAGQRCTTIRRAIVHKDLYESFTQKLIQAYRQVRIGSPLETDTLMGPLIDRKAVDDMQKALDELRKLGGKVLYGGEVLKGGLYDAGTYVSPCICEARPDMAIVREETFAPLLYVMKYETIEEAIAIHNSVPQGLSSAIFTTDLRDAELFLSQRGSDCGIANVNGSTSGAEIGGAFGGEKDTGGGRESGSDAWKTYMRRQTVTVNWSKKMPLAQGISFGTSEGE